MRRHHHVVAEAMRREAEEKRHFDESQFRAEQRARWAEEDGEGVSPRFAAIFVGGGIVLFGALIIRNHLFGNN